MVKKKITEPKIASSDEVPAPPKGTSERILYCSFCGKSQHEVLRLIAGPEAFICDECIELCNDILREGEHGPKAAISAMHFHLRHIAGILDSLSVQLVVPESSADPGA